MDHQRLQGTEATASVTSSPSSGSAAPACAVSAPMAHFQAPMQQPGGALMAHFQAQVQHPFGAASSLSTPPPFPAVGAPVQSGASYAPFSFAGAGYSGQNASWSNPNMMGGFGQPNPFIATLGGKRLTAKESQLMAKIVDEQQKQAMMAQIQQHQQTITQMGFQIQQSQQFMKSPM